MWSACASAGSCKQQHHLKVCTACSGLNAEAGMRVRTGVLWWVEGVERVPCKSGTGAHEVLVQVLMRYEEFTVIGPEMLQ